jgi:hypothetical protein
MAYSYAVWSYGPVGGEIPRFDGQERLNFVRGMQEGA